jgi:flagellar basal-body rod protein FlgF
MDNAMYVGLSRQMTLRRQMDVVANNIANQDTTGFKVEHLILAEDPQSPAKTLGGPAPVKFVLDTGVARDFSQGTMRTTGNSLDLAIEGPGFFQITTPDGPRYTRDGRFTLDASSRLTTQKGDILVGDGGAILVDTQKGPISISQDGIISQAGQRIGAVRPVQFASLSSLEKTGDGLYRNTANVQPTPATTAQLHQGMLEGSNVNAIKEITDMIEVSRAYERMARLVEQTAKLSEDAIARLGKLS